MARSGYRAIVFASKWVYFLKDGGRHAASQTLNQQPLLSVSEYPHHKTSVSIPNHLILDAEEWC